VEIREISAALVIFASRVICHLQPRWQKDLSLAVMAVAMAVVVRAKNYSRDGRLFSTKRAV